VPYFANGWARDLTKLVDVFDRRFKRTHGQRETGPRKLPQHPVVRSQGRPRIEGCIPVPPALLRICALPKTSGFAIRAINISKRMANGSTKLIFAKIVRLEQRRLKVSLVLQYLQLERDRELPTDLWSVVAGATRINPACFAKLGLQF